MLCLGKGRPELAGAGRRCMLWRAGQLHPRLYQGHRLFAAVIAHTQQAYSAAPAVRLSLPEEHVHLAAQAGLAVMAATQRTPQLLSVAPM